MAFNSYEDFIDFEQEVKYKSRFVHSVVVAEFLANLERTLVDRQRLFAAASSFYRGQAGYVATDAFIDPFPPERMKPLENKAREGRANPKGISYLYLANDEATALAELRPHVGQQISIAQFKSNKPLNVIDCFSVKRHYSLFELSFNSPVLQEEIVNAIWSLINYSFTRPVTNTDDTADYVPTQILTEFFRSKGYDGICVKSGLGPGYNFILFNRNDADVASCTVMQTESVDYKYRESGRRYVLTKKP